MITGSVCGVRGPDNTESRSVVTTRGVNRGIALC
jgi:hypothetical protein